MKKVLKVICIVLAVWGLFSLVLVGIAVLNPFNLRAKIVGYVANVVIESSFKSDDEASQGDQVITDHPLLNDEQEKVLVDLGVDLSNIPTSISVESQTCLINLVGESRANEIVNGSAPTSEEIIKAQVCL